jgi:outer membrane protein TolC
VRATTGGAKAIPVRAAALAAALASCIPYGSGYDDFVGLPRAALEETGPVTDVAAPEAAPAGPLEIGVSDAIVLALRNNRAFSVRRLGLALASTFVEEARAAFDPELSFGADASEEKSGSGAPIPTSSVSAEAEISRALPTGTVVGVDVSGGRTDGGFVSDSHKARVGLTVSQPLLRGASRAANLAEIAQASLDVRASEFELRGLAEALVADVERAYWDCVLAERRIGIFEESVDLAGKQLGETEERIRVGRLPETELAAARAEAALRREDLINARSDFATKRLRLLRLTSPAGPGAWERPLVLKDAPAPPEREVGAPGEHVALAMENRPDLNEARLAVRRGDIALVRTRNGLLPRLDLFVTLGKSGYASSFTDAWGDLDGESRDERWGLVFEKVLGGGPERARHLRATVTREQAALALANLEELAEMDVRAALIEVARAREQIAATGATREFREEALRAETEKFRVGRSTTILVASAQRDLVASRIAEVSAVVAHLVALVDLHSAEGTLLNRRGIRAPGAERRRSVPSPSGAGIGH